MTRGPLASDLLRSAAPARAGIGRSGIPNASSAANLPYRMHLARLAAACAAVIVLLPAMAAAQAQMPDPAMIHGRAIPAGELPDGRVTVRVVRESIGNDVPAQQVRVTVNGAATTATTDAEGRAEFPSLPKGMQGVAEVTVDGEALVSQPFTVPDSGGLRVILVAGMAEAAARKAKEAEAEAAQPPTQGTVVFGDNSRVLIQFADDGLQVYYILNVVNNARGRVDIGGPLLIDLPRGAADQQGLIRRRDTLLRDLEEVETRRRAGTGNRERNDARRQHLLNELEQVYGALDDAAAGPQGGGEGVAA
jgi:hypothetical protein